MLELPEKDFTAAILNTFENLENVIIEEEKLRIEKETIKKRTKWKFLTEKYNVWNEIFIYQA